MELWVCTKWGGDGYGKGLSDADVCILLETSVFREVVFPNSALLMSLSLEVCSANTVLQRQDIRGSKGRGTAIDLVPKTALSTFIFNKNAQKGVPGQGRAEQAWWMPMRRSSVS